MGRSEAVDGTVVLEGQAVDYRLYRVARRKRIHLVIGEDGWLQVRAPRRCTRASAERAILAHRSWALAALERARAAAERRPRLEHGGELPWLGERLRLSLEHDPRARVARSGVYLRVCAPELEPGCVRELVTGWYRYHAREALGGRLMGLAEQTGLRPQRVSIRDQRTRWGSCSCRGTISLNWRLVLAPPDLVDYVLLHELCHLRHLNHSAAFWALLAGFVPDWRERRLRLRKLQPELAF